MSTDCCTLPTAPALVEHRADRHSDVVGPVEAHSPSGAPGELAIFVATRAVSNTALQARLKL